MKRLAAVLMTLMLLAAALTVPALAIDRFDPNQELSLTVHFEVDEEPVKAARFRLYRVADMVGYGDLIYTDSFKDCEAGALVDLTSEQTQLLCEKLYSYLTEHTDIAPVDTGATDETGDLRFPSQNKTLLPGLYFLTSDRFYLNGVSHEAAPFIVCLPYRGEDEIWLYDMAATPKMADTQIFVQKTWQDKGNEKNRPEGVWVELLQGKEKKVYADALLTAENDWAYTWEDLPGGYEWDVIEKLEVPHYKASVSRIPGGYEITNTYVAPPEKTLPQTGLLWWPVPVLACAGVLLFVLGWVKQRKYED